MQCTRSYTAPPPFRRDKLAAVWYDITAYYSTPNTKIEPAKENLSAIGGILTTTLGVLATIVGVISLPAGGLGLPAIVAGVATVVGGMATLGGVAILVADTVLYPVSLANMYGAHDYTITVTGNMNIVLDPATHYFTVAGVSPIGMEWQNTTRGTGGVAVGRIDEPIDPPDPRRAEPDGVITVQLPYTGNIPKFTHQNNMRLEPGSFKIYYDVDVADGKNIYHFAVFYYADVFGGAPTSAGQATVFKVSWARGVEGWAQLSFVANGAEYFVANVAQGSPLVGNATSRTLFAAELQPEGGYYLYFGDELQYWVTTVPHGVLVGSSTVPPNQFFFRNELESS